MRRSGQTVLPPHPKGAVGQDQAPSQSISTAFIGLVHPSVPRGGTAITGQNLSPPPNRPEMLSQYLPEPVGSALFAMNFLPAPGDILIMWKRMASVVLSLISRLGSARSMKKYQNMSLPWRKVHSPLAGQGRTFFFDAAKIAVCSAVGLRCFRSDRLSIVNVVEGKRVVTFDLSRSRSP